MKKLGPSHEEGHLFVAAVRLLQHVHNRPPTVEEIGEMLFLSPEIAHHRARGLEEKGIVRIVANPFETLVEIADYLALEDLPREEAGPGFGEDLTEFEEKKRKEQEKLKSLFSSGEPDRKKQGRIDKLEEEFRKFRKLHEEEPGED